MEFSLIEEKKTHLRECDVCLKAKTSDEMCALMQSYLDKGRRSYQREFPVDPYLATYLNEKLKAELKKPVSKHTRRLAEMIDFNVLSLRQQHCIKLFYFEGLGIREIGKKLRVSHSTVNREINRGIQRLRRIFAVPMNQKYISEGEKLNLARMYEFVLNQYRRHLSPISRGEKEIQAIS